MLAPTLSATIARKLLSAWRQRGTARVTVRVRVRVKVRVRVRVRVTATGHRFRHEP